MFEGSVQEAERKLVFLEYRRTRGEWNEAADIGTEPDNSGPSAVVQSCLDFFTLSNGEPLRSLRQECGMIRLMFWKVPWLQCGEHIEEKEMEAENQLGEFPGGPG